MFGQTVTQLYKRLRVSENGSMELRLDLDGTTWVVFNTITKKPQFIGGEYEATSYWDKLYPINPVE